MAIEIILVAVAIEGHDDPVARRVAQLAERHGARLIALHVIEDLDTEEHSFADPADLGTINEILRTDAQDRLRKLFSTHVKTK